jgi:HEAT repeat protein
MIQFVLAALLAAIPEQEGIRRVQAHLLIEAPRLALEEAEQIAKEYPDSLNVQKIYLEALAANGLEEQALDLWNSLSQKHPDFLYDRYILEEIAWGVLKKGIQSTQYGVKLASMIGSYLTRDVRAVPILLKMMRDSNAVIRSIAVQMSAAFQDAPLKDEVKRLILDEKVWMVRLEVIKAVGALKIKELTPTLQALVRSEKTTIEERGVAIEALIAMYEDFSYPEFQALCKSNRAGLRHLAATAAEHFRLKEAKEDIVVLMKDSNSAVRIAAINAFGLVYREQYSEKEAMEILSDALEDSDPKVAITACWASLLIDPEKGQKHMKKWLSDLLPENRRMAAAALAASGSRGVNLGIETIKTSSDPYVKANIALGLIGQRTEVALSADLIYDFLENEKRMWMIDKKANPLFEILSPSQVRHNDQIPNYPEAQDQMTRLHLLSLLALVDDPRAVSALKTFLQRKRWGISGVAAATLLHEGDDTALDVVKQLLDDEDSNVRLQACLVLAFFCRDDSILLQLQGAYAGADHEKKLHILEALGKIGNANSYSFLMGVLREPFPVLRVAAAAALIQSVNR